MFGEEEVPHFNAPIIQDNSTGWGPCDMPDQFKDMPYQPFSKGDRLGKVMARETYRSGICMKFVM
jgi:translation initiation factor 3 subunit D